MSRFDNAFTESMRRWLDDENRDYNVGATILFRLRANPIEFRKCSADPEGNAEYIFAQVKKFYDFRVADIPHDHVVQQVSKAESIVTQIDSQETRSGKRADHDSLPDNIKKCYVDNLDLMRRISDAHAKIRLIIASNASCKDIDLLPFANQIIELDKRRLKNWKTYDSYRAEK